MAGSTVKSAVGRSSDNGMTGDRSRHSRELVDRGAAGRKVLDHLGGDLGRMPTPLVRSP
jgi:hypothetical protein